MPAQEFSDSSVRERARGAWRRVLDEPEVVLGQLILLAFVALTSVQVILRYVANAPLTWPEELNAILLVWLTFIGAMALARRDGHIRVELVEELCGRKINLTLDLIFGVITIAFLVYLVIGGWYMFHELEFERTPALRWKLNYVYAIVPISAALMIVIYLRRLGRTIQLLLSGRPHGD